MSQAAAMPSRSFAVRELVEVGWATRRYSFAWAAGIMLLAVAGAMLIAPKYPSNATLLLMLGPEYTVRSNAEEVSMANVAMDADHITASETAILGSDDLHRQVLHELGLENVYPDYIHPGLLKRWTRDAKAAIAALFSSSSDEDIDPVEFALQEFTDHLSVVASRQGNVITVTFGHEDPAVAQKVLARLMQDFLSFRRLLYSNEQSEALQRQLLDSRARLDGATQDLAEFRLKIQVGSYDTRMEILLHEQGDAENDANEAESQAAQQAARVDALTKDLSRMTPTVSGGSDTDIDARLAPLRTTLDALRAKRAEALASYLPDSVVVRTLSEQIRQREAELAAGRADRVASATHTVLNTVYQGAQTDLTRAEADLRAAQARESADKQQLAAVAARINDMQQSRRRLDELERQQAVTDDIYRSTAKLLDARQASEEIEARKTPSVRVAQAADFPLHPKPTRLIIIAIGVFLSGAGAVGIPVLANFLRRTFLLPQSLEFETGMPVLAAVPRQQAAIAGASSGRR